MKKKPILPFLFSLIIFGLLACSSPPKTPTELKEGSWKGTLELREGANLPFLFSLKKEGASYKIVIQNDTERIEVDEISQTGDSLLIKMPVFSTEFKLAILSPTELSGNWYDYTRGIDYHLPFHAIQGEENLFKVSGNTQAIAPKYALTFDPKGEEPSVAIGKFVQKGDKVSGTFLTETGDYRYLDGVMDGKTLKLAAFDGSHAFLFIAEVEGEAIAGNFWAGNHWLEPWEGKADPDAQIREPDALTYLKEGYEDFTFNFPDLEGNSVSFEDDRYKDKVVIVQIMGSWCPNCMDETRLYAEWYKKYQGQGLEIVGVAFERTSKGLEQAQKNVKRMAKRLGAEYSFLIAATNNDKGEASEKFPMLNKIISFPTSIFLDKKGRVRKVHTGFNGPGTGEVYLQYVEEYQAFLQKMLAEEA